ncbi:MAG TPA: SpoIIE family protein phosphatase [Acidimicrobiia bacterium]|nr:SpoIIE family protein phosphatase [Acidimicrobiia bacterium]
MARGLALLRFGYFLIVGIILIAVLPFAFGALPPHATGALVGASIIALALGLLFRSSVRGQLERDEVELREQLAFADIHRVASLLAPASTTEEVGRIGVRELARALRADAVHLWVHGDRERLTLVGATDSLADSGSAPSVLSSLDVNAPADALRSGEALYFGDRDAYANRYPGWVGIFDVQGAQSAAVVPMHDESGGIGVLEVFYAKPQAFGDTQRGAHELYASQLAIALGRAQTRNREYAAATRLQESLLGPPQLVPGVGHTSRYLPADSGLSVGGDWHNTHRLPDGRILIAVGDVVGRGIDAATVMGQLRSAVVACALRCSTPSELLLCLDQFAEDLQGALSTTVALAFVDPEAETLTYVCAGHPPPLLVSPSGSVTVLDNAITWPLAVGPDRPAGLGATVSFPAGSMVLLYSDGLIERRREPLDEGIARVVRSVRANWNLPLDTVCDRVMDDSLPDARRDDVALLALRSPVATRDVFLMKLDAKSQSVGRVRESLRGWLDNLGLDPDDQLAILVAVGEASTNAVEHAYTSMGTNLFRVEACCRDGEVTCCVTDSGAWKDNAIRTARGNGLAIMQELMDRVDIERRPGGTAVTLTYRIEAHTVGERDASALHR